MASEQLLCAKKEYCKKQVFTSLKAIHVVPFETGNVELNKYLSFFLHRAPNISSSHATVVLPEKQNMLWASMFENRRFVIKDFCSSNTPIEKRMTPAGLGGNRICLKCKRFVCKRKKATNGVTETDFDCFLRHIRNSIAHGNVHYQNAGNRIFIVFDDYSDTKKLSARIVCLRADLEHWYKTLTKNN